MTSSGWVSVRCVFRLHFGEEQVYEERVTLWQESDVDRAIELAEAEAVEYAGMLSTGPGDVAEYLGLAQAYILDELPGRGAEVFSLIRTSSLAPRQYLDTFFDTGTERVGGIIDGS